MERTSRAASEPECIESCALTPSERRSSRRYLVELGIATAAYVGLILLSVGNVDRTEGAEKILLALLPTFGAILMVVAVVRFVLRMDELQRRAFSDAAAISGLIVAIVTIAIGFSENAGFPRVSVLWVFPMLSVTWGIVLPIVRKQYLG